MPICAIVGCSSRSGRDKLSLFSVPSIITRECEKTFDLSRRRRALWLERINRADLGEKDVKVHTRVCAKHFLSGKPSKLFDEDSPDWAPSLNLGCDSAHPAVPEPSQKKGHRPKAKARKVFRRKLEVVDPLSIASVELRCVNEDDDALEEGNWRLRQYPWFSDPNFESGIGCQTDFSGKELDHLRANYDRLMKDNIALRADVERLRSHVEECPLSKKVLLAKDVSQVKLYTADL